MNANDNATQEKAILPDLIQTTFTLLSYFLTKTHLGRNSLKPYISNHFILLPLTNKALHVLNSAVQCFNQINVFFFSANRPLFYVIVFIVQCAMFKNYIQYMFAYILYTVRIRNELQD